MGLRCTYAGDDPVDSSDPSGDIQTPCGDVPNETVFGGPPDLGQITAQCSAHGYRPGRALWDMAWAVQSEIAAYNSGEWQKGIGAVRTRDPPWRASSNGRPAVTVRRRRAGPTLSWASRLSVVAAMSPALEDRRQVQLPQTLKPRCLRRIPRSPT